MGRCSGDDFLNPMILKILKDSKIPMSTLGINYRINEGMGRIVNLNVVRNHLVVLLKDKKISETINDEGVVHYRLLL